LKSSQESTKPAAKERNTPFVLLHSGTLYPVERDPRTFFSAISTLKEEGILGADSLSIVLRATGNDDYIGALISRYEVADIVTVEKGVSYRKALQEMIEVDGLLIFQAANCNCQVPAKLYEYMRVGKPIFALADSQGDTAKLLQSEGIDTVVDLDNEKAIENGLRRFVRMLETGGAPVMGNEQVRKYRRSHQANELAEILNDLRKPQMLD